MRPRPLSSVNTLSIPGNISAGVEPCRGNGYKVGVGFSSISRCDRAHFLRSMIGCPVLRKPGGQWENLLYSKHPRAKGASFVVDVVGKGSIV